MPFSGFGSYLEEGTSVSRLIPEVFQDIHVKVEPHDDEQEIDDQLLPPPTIRPDYFSAILIKKEELE